MREGDDCNCEEGWGGLNCNVCQTDSACDALMPEDKDGTCYTQGIVVKENHQMCDVTNRKILDQLKEKKPQITFACSAEDATCNFQCKTFDPVDLLSQLLSSRSLGGQSGILLLRSRDMLFQLKDGV